MPLIEIRQLRAGYGEIEVLHGIDLAIEPGEMVCLIGANGAGKSTLLRAISGLVARVEGEIRFADRTIRGIPDHRIPGLGIAHVPEGRHVFASLTVLENLRLGYFAAGGRVRWRDQLDRVFALFPILAERRSQLGGTLSGGEQQMLAMGRAMMSAPQLLLLDEPSLGLAPVMVDRVFALIGDLNRQGTTLLLVEQNAFRALQAARRGYILEGGRIMMQGPAGQLAADPAVQRLYLGG
ncbi:MAG: ABC transporter ATP-binding protein [Dongiaceae bacterium]